MPITAEIALKNEKNLIDHLRKKSNRSLINKRTKTILANLSNRLVLQARLNVTNQGLVKTGTLRQSIDTKIRKSGDTINLLFGVFGIKYAAVHEFGFNGLVNVKAHNRVVTKLFGRKLKKPLTLSIGSHKRNMKIPKRPYMIPAIISQREYIIDKLLELFSRPSD